MRYRFGEFGLGKGVEISLEKSSVPYRILDPSQSTNVRARINMRMMRTPGTLIGVSPIESLPGIEIPRLEAVGKQNLNLGKAVQPLRG